MWTPHQRKVISMYRAVLSACRALPVPGLRQKMCYNAREAMLVYRHPSFRPATRHLLQRGQEAVDALEELASLQPAVWASLLRKGNVASYQPTHRTQEVMQRRAQQEWPQTESGATASETT